MANPQHENGHLKLSNEVVDHLCKLTLHSEEWKVLWAVLRKTYGWNKKSDNISLSQLSEMTGLRRQNVVRARDKLVSRRILGVINGDNRTSTTYLFIKDYEKWEVNPTYEGSLKTPSKVVSTMRHTKDNTKDNIYTMSGETTPSTSFSLSKTIQEAQKIWNEYMPWKIRTLTGTRLKHLKQRLKEEEFKNNYSEILEKILKSNFLMGKRNSDKHSGFKADFDWIIRNDTNYIKILEGKYDNARTLQGDDL